MGSDLMIAEARYQWDCVGYLYQSLQFARE